MMMTTRGKTAPNDAYAQLQPAGSAQVSGVFEDESHGCHGLIAWFAFVRGNRLRFTALLQDLIQRCGNLLKSIGEQLDVPVMQRRPLGCRMNRDGKRRSCEVLMIPNHHRISFHLRCVGEKYALQKHGITSARRIDVI
jgi:hypothetical protein